MGTEKKTRFAGIFFLCASASMPSARCAFGAPHPNWIALVPHLMSHARLDQRCALYRLYGIYATSGWDLESVDLVFEW